MTIPNDINELKLLVVQLLMRIEELEKENAELRARLGMNSSNSSKPPSSDGYKKPSKPPQNSNKKKGGQKGHKGNTLQQVEIPDIVEQHKVEQCTCGACLINVDSILISRHQVFDLPEPKLLITEHQVFKTICPKCGKEHYGKPPETVSSPVQYGNGVRAFVTLLNNSYKIPIKKIQQLFMDLFGYPINESTIISINKQAYGKLEFTEEIIKNKITNSEVANADETGVRVEGVLQWLHTMSTLLFTYLFVHKKRGRKAMDSPESIIPDFKGWLIHDCLRSYFKYNHLKHGVCGAHLLREFQALIDNENSKWAHTFQKFLLEILNMPFEKRLSFRSLIEYRYDKICKIANRLEPEPEKKTGRGRKKKTKGRNLLERLVEHKGAVLAFAFNENVPFTNNLAERDIRPAKLKQKISGCFRTFEGAKIYARIESFVSTVRKNQLNIFKELKNTFNGYNFLTICEIPT